MGNNVHLGDGVFDEAKTAVNDRTRELVRIAIDTFFNYLESKAKSIPEAIKQLRSNPETEQEIAALWSKQLFEEGLVPKGYNGLPNTLLISNFHQEGYLDGLYAGYILAMMALVDNEVPQDIILAIRDYIRPNLMGHCYDNRDEFSIQYADEKYNWIDNA